MFDQHNQVGANDFRSLECDGLATSPRDFAIFLAGIYFYFKSIISFVLLFKSVVVVVLKS